MMLENKEICHFSLRELSDNEILLNPMWSGGYKNILNVTTITKNGDINSREM